MSDYSRKSFVPEWKPNTKSPKMIILEEFRSIYGNATEAKLGEFEKSLNDENITDAELDKFKKYWKWHGSGYFPRLNEIWDFVDKIRKTYKKTEVHAGCKYFICEGNGWIGIDVDGVDKMANCCACKGGVEKFGSMLGFVFKPELITSRIEYLAQFEKSRITKQQKIEIETHMIFSERAHATVKNPLQNKPPKQGELKKLAQTPAKKPIQTPANVTDLNDIKGNDMASFGDIMEGGKK